MIPKLRSDDIAGEEECVKLCGTKTLVSQISFSREFAAGLPQHRVFTEITLIYHVYLFKMVLSV